MAQLKENNKEIPLFEQKSVKDEAYRQKILQLEKEISRLGTIAKVPHYHEPKRERLNEHAHDLYYESLSHFDKRIRRDNEFLEKKASELTERLNLQAQRMALSIESRVNHKLRWTVFSALALISLLLVIFAGVLLLIRNKPPIVYTVGSVKGSNYQDAGGQDSGRRLSYINDK